ncbi:hypothetical protein ACO0QE_000882 [Hanseniaspora vineae]
MSSVSHITKVNDLFNDKPLSEIEEYLQDTINDELVVLGNQLYTQLQDQTLINDVILETCGVYADIYNTNCNDIENNLMSLCFDKDDAVDYKDREEGGGTLDIIPMDYRTFTEQDNESVLDSIFEKLSTTRFHYDLELKLEEFTQIDSEEKIDRYKTFNELYPKMLSFDSTQSNQTLDIFDKYYESFCKTLESLDIEQYTTTTGERDGTSFNSSSSSSSSSSNGTKNTLHTVNLFIGKLVSLYQSINQENMNVKYKKMLSIVSMQLIKIYHYIDVNDLSYTFNNAYVNIKKLLIGKNDEMRENSVSLKQMYVDFIKSEIVSLSEKISMDSLREDAGILDFYHTTGSKTDRDISSMESSTIDTHHARDNYTHNLYNHIEHYYVQGWYRPDMIDIGTKLNYINQLFHQLETLTSSSSTDQHDFQANIYKNVLNLASYKKDTKDTILSPFSSKISSSSSSSTTSTTAIISNDMITNGSVDTDGLINSIISNSNNHRWNSYLDTLCKNAV